MFSFRSSRMVPQFFVPYHINSQRGQSVSLKKFPPSGCCQIVSSWFHFTCFSLIQSGSQGSFNLFLARICHRFFKILFSDNETNSKSLWKNLNTKRSRQPIVLLSQDKYILVISCQPFVLCMGRKRDKGRKYINILFKNKMKLTDSLCGKVCVCECM